MLFPNIFTPPKASPQATFKGVAYSYCPQILRGGLRAPLRVLESWPLRSNIKTIGRATPGGLLSRSTPARLRSGKPATLDKLTTNKQRRTTNTRTCHANKKKSPAPEHDARQKKKPRQFYPGFYVLVLFFCCWLFYICQR